MNSITNPNLINISTIEINDEQVKTISARDLHSYLEVGKFFANWIKERINQYEFIENEDYFKSITTSTPAENTIAKIGNRVNPSVAGNNTSETAENICPITNSIPKSRFKTRIDYYLTLNMAKELCMIEKNHKGKLARKYFIEVEKKYQQGLVANNSNLVSESKIQQYLTEMQTKVTELVTQKVNDSIVLNGKILYNLLVKKIETHHTPKFIPQEDTAKPNTDGNLTYYIKNEYNKGKSIRQLSRELMTTPRVVRRHLELN